uniref:BAP29/BAP31 transmembrane domain-containing protein n=1 Tax=Ditylum brightwellii TaxID=49249 RepID=A0A7S4T419_9STRA|mmetsp:Transcript_15727/g.20931  ORF Transcript_15727/g.20931 Transcript_15727/m.20931 type:complete len:172 (+) Transcript_15727:185-700(+)
MGLWAQLIWVFFPIPILSLFLLSASYPPALERLGANIVHRIFFTRINVGPLRIQLLWLFFSISVLIFINTLRILQYETQCKTCVHPGEISWYRKAMKFRKERNFWLSLFNVALWYLVLVVYNLKKKILKLKEQINELKALQSSAEEATEAKKDEAKKEDETEGEDETKKDK